MKRTPMGPGTSEPEQRSYVVRFEGETTIAMVLASHGLDAAREVWDARGLGSPLGEDSVAGGWAVFSDTRTVIAWPVGSPQASAALAEHERVRREDDERAATQQRIAAAIRAVKLVDNIRADFDRACAAIVADGHLSDVQWGMLAGLLLAAEYPDMLDAVNQVATVHRLERGE